MTARRVAVLGAGLAAAPHLAALERSDCEVVTVATRDEDRAAKVRQRFPDARRCWPPETALQDGVDLALVLSPPGTHLELAGEAAARGIDVIVEKPLDIGLRRAAELVRVTRDTGLAVCFQHRAKAAGRALKDLYGDLGPLTGGGIDVPWWRPQSYYDEPGRGTYARDGGGVLITQAVHVLDLFLWTVGTPERVMAHAGTSALHRMEAEDTLAAILDYGDGRIVTLNATTAAPPGRDERITLACAGGTAVLTGGELVLHRADGTAEAVAREDGTATAADPSLMPAGWHQAVLDDALDAFASGREPLASGASALATQRVVAALYASAARGRWVDTDDETLEEQ
ncbi:Gfo/Idh/MocA family oxidoreductase [Actinomadura darangshiensis]|uniref:Gfo/Idh/MocA family oxidoreductase n=1 Tax=Actinomadura darangshiensis TaxID=705336 RepID=A0A4R5BAG1_9ACTN|nr:Gfo/Idh/MocA family oxidoreductase [Actinomadura darangshiensis]TDD83051.1 Gfo/Idh/MocA family oxidoreductase [Actinomadura darangshiensis]